MRTEIIAPVNINLGVKTIWWKIRVILLAPLWAMSVSETKKSWPAFKSGLIKHECDWDYENPVTDSYGKHYPCRHYGCNIVSMRNKNGTWTWKA